MSYEQLTDLSAFWFVENIGGLKFERTNVCENIYPSIITNLSPTKVSLFGKRKELYSISGFFGIMIYFM